MRITSPARFNPSDYKEESYRGQVSMTQPNEAMSIAEILQRFARGLPTGAVPFMDDLSEFDGTDADFDQPDLSAATREDLVDREQMIQSGIKAKDTLRRARSRAHDTLEDPIAPRVRSKQGVDRNSMADGGTPVGPTATDKGTNEPAK